MGDNITDDDIYKVMDLFFKQRYTLYRHHHDSFDRFLDRTITEYLESEDMIFHESLALGTTIKHTHKFRVSNVGIKTPINKITGKTLTPTDARIHNLTLDVTVVAKIEQIHSTRDVSQPNIPTEETIIHQDDEYPLFTIPLMVGSKYCMNILANTDESKNLECPYDAGGYFIIGGSEKIVISSERMVVNKPLVFMRKRNNASYPQVQINSRSLNNNENVQIINIFMEKKNQLTVRIPVLGEINLHIILLALGISNDKTIADLIVEDRDDSDMKTFVMNSLAFSVDTYGNPIKSKDEAETFLMTKLRKSTRYTTTNEALQADEKRVDLRKILGDTFLPHVTGGPLKKAWYLAYATRKLIHCLLGREKTSDRDSYENKQIDLVADFFNDIFRTCMKRMIAECGKKMSKETINNNIPPNVIPLIKNNTVGSSLTKALANGVFGKRKGIAQVLPRTTYLQLISTLKKINSPTADRSADKLISPRLLHGTQIGMLCPVETPEGAKVGYVKHMCLISTVTVMKKDQVSIITQKLQGKIEDHQDVNPEQLGQYVKVFLNGDWLGLTRDPKKLYDELKQMKYSGAIDNMTSVTFNIKSELDCNEIKINCMGGRLVKIALRVVDNKLLLTKEIVADAAKTNTWIEYMNKYPGVFEYIDVDESVVSLASVTRMDLDEAREKMESSKEYSKKLKIDSNYVVQNRYGPGMFIKYTHCELHPSLLLGVIAANAPFCERNQGPRNMFQFSQAKQALGTYATNYRHRLDTSYILYYPQRPLVNTRLIKYIGTDKLPYGENMIVVFACYTGYNQEDSIIINKAAINRGLSRIVSFKKFSSIIQKNPLTTEEDTFGKPDSRKVIGMKHANYEKLNEDGYVPQETFVINGDILISKQKPTKPVDGKQFKDDSEVYKSGVPGRVDKVWANILDSNGYSMIKMRIRSDRSPEIGDKFCCYTPDHDVLTFAGWKPIAQVTMADKIATLDENHQLVYLNPTAIQTYNVKKANMYVVHSTQVKLRVTTNHRMYIRHFRRKDSKYQIEEASELLHKRVKYIKKCDGYVNDLTNLPSVLGVVDGKIAKFNFFDENNIKIFDIDIIPWLTFFGIFMAEGWVKKRYNGEGEVIGFSGIGIAAHKDRVYDILTGHILPKFNIEHIKTGYDGNEKERKKGERNNIISIRKRMDGPFATAIVAYMLQFSVGAINKKLPEWVWRLTPDLAEELIKGLLLGDGHLVKNKNPAKTSDTWRYDTSSINLRDGFQRLCLHAGYCANSSLKYKANHTSYKKIKVGVYEAITSRVDSYRLTTVKKQSMPLVNKNIKLDKDNNNALIGGARDRIEKNYTGKVHCCTVPGIGVIYVRRSGIPVWCGQSRHGQKGTCGLLLEGAHMMFTEKGIQPDVIFNPNAVPSRMTVGQLIEAIASKAGALGGYEVDGTQFGHISMQEIKDKLIGKGYDGDGLETMYCGVTGRKMKSMMFICPTYYLRLKHLVKDKIHSRSIGSMQLLTRQPPEGRGKDGGLRCGEMERDALIAYAISRFLKERYMETSDGYKTRICDKCGFFAQRKIVKGSGTEISTNDIFYCKNCDQTTNITPIMLPYACKLFFQEIMAANIAPRIKTENSLF